MTDQITVPKQTWDALREALKHGILEMNLSGKAKECMPLHHALTAANAVSVEPLKVTDLGRYALEPQVEQVDLYGTKDGVLVHLGKAAMPPRMKARELAREQFGHFEDDDGSDADLCFYALERLIEHMYAQGFKIAHPQATEPTGYKLVPVEPTPAMLYAIQNDCDILPPRGKRIWAAMLAAAPEAKQ